MGLHGLIWDNITIKREVGKRDPDRGEAAILAGMEGDRLAENGITFADNKAGLTP
jgi:hypothetical protein